MATMLVPLKLPLRVKPRARLVMLSLAVPVLALPLAPVEKVSESVMRSVPVGVAGVPSTTSCGRPKLAPVLPARSVTRAFRLL